jgi:transposase InsO family protein
MIRWYNEERLHSALGFLRQADYYRGEPDALREERRRGRSVRLS